jgi:DNA polymerase sigma
MKSILKKKGLNSAFTGGLSSFCTIILVKAYLIYRQ